MISPVGCSGPTRRAGRRNTTVPTLHLPIRRSPGTGPDTTQPAAVEVTTAARNFYVATVELPARECVVVAMTVAATGEMCRLTICGPARQIEVAVPAHVAVSDLLPVLVEHLGDNLVETGLLHGGWVLQRLGDPPFDQGATVAGLGLRDGDLLHLRPRSEQIPPVDFDDLVDGVATGVKQRPGRWQAALTGWTARATTVIVLALGVGVLAQPGHAGYRALAATALTLACLVGSLIATVAAADRPFGVIFAAGALGYAGLAGLLVTDPRPGVVGLSLDAPALFTASAAILATAGLTALAIAPARPVLVAIIVADVLAVAASALSTFTGLTIMESAASLVVVTVLAAMVVPPLAFRLAGLRLAPLPTKPEHLQEELDPIPSTQLLPRAAVADRMMTSLYAGLAIPAMPAIVIVAVAPGWAPPTLVALFAVVRCLAVRPMTSGWHRLAQLAPAGVGVVALTLSHAPAGTSAARVAGVALAVVVGCVLLFLLARTLPRRRLTPYWGRAGDLVETVTAAAVLPVFLAVLDVYGLARAIGG